ncbi:MAG: hypothetical protein ACO3EZ_19145 [Prochlorotrichaceae cyanobacterium]
MGLNLDLTKRAPLEEAAREAFKDAFDTALIELADYLQRNSPRGVSSAGDSLAGGWDIKPARKRRGVIPQVIGEVVNTADAAEFRIRGRGPGKQPPINKIERWALANGISPYALAKAIAKRGTRRWREKDNILKQDPITLEFSRSSPLYTVFERKLEEEWGKIKL